MISTRYKEASTGTSEIPRANSLAGDVYEAIFNQLMSLKIAPGARITVDNLVKEFNVSQTPIREALGRLDGTRHRFDELYELRLLLEPAGAAKAARAMNDERLAILREAAGVMMRSDNRDERANYSAFARQDAIFHDRIMEFAGNALIREMLTFQHTHFHIFRLMFHRRVTEEALGEHQTLLDAFAAKDPDAAADAMRIHIERSRDRLLPAFDEI
jgi:DNA-binding GntR family transcriptional regulator